MRKPSVATAFMKFLFTAKKSMHSLFNFGQPYGSAQTKTEATVSAETFSHSLSSHITLRRSSANWSAATSKCIIISAKGSPSSTFEGKASVYENWRRDSKSDGYYCQRLSLSPQGFAIPTMHGLRYLQLSGDSFTRDVVPSIADGCPNLQSLDISHIPCLSREDIILLQAKCSIVEDDDGDHKDSDDDFYYIDFYDPYYDGLLNI